MIMWMYGAAKVYEFCVLRIQLLSFVTHNHEILAYSSSRSEVLPSIAVIAYY